MYGVAMSRSLGDMQCHPFVIPTPDTSVRRAALALLRTSSDDVFTSLIW